jgi:bifunctional non-homologous end joining protein LigD
VIAGALDFSGQAIIDGEVVVVHEGRTNSRNCRLNLPRVDRIGWSTTPSTSWCDGDLRKLPQSERKQPLLNLLGENGIEAPVVYSEHLVGDGQEMFSACRQVEVGGYHFQAAHAPYRSERTESWLKIKTTQREKVRSARESPRQYRPSLREPVSQPRSRKPSAHRLPVENEKREGQS